ncbi:Glycerophosphodiester phosphodiesterase [Flagellimonas maritima]|uniref:Glycerophosphodiester phosphodiesterase n=1 Tax=Flagellimonas maritima TaxID=1383885 RepID=A0A2Z4LSS6_9FLAO|nr:family 16 glycosylhydrolase [Allomuricauda aurantiaca]AWX44955.1 Glycerophosphodiester phosphodiesterase [Allomuricauda aurantiaca]
MTKIELAAVVCFFMTSCQNIFNVDAISTADNPVIAHRGDWKKNGYPKNSIAALKQAIKNGYTGSEFDVRMTKDEVLIVTHDAEYADLVIEESNYEELSLHKLPNGEILPKLSDFLRAGMADNDSTAFFLELKPSKNKKRNIKMARKTLQLVEEVNAKSHIGYYISFSYEILKEIKKVSPNAKVQYLNGYKKPTELKHDKIDGLDYQINTFRRHPKWIEKAKKLDLKLNSWTVNKSEDIKFLLANKFDYITTDEPELALRLSKINTTNSDWNLVWSDEFDYSGKVDSTKWSYEIGLKRNQEKQFYTDSLKNVRVENGKLILEAHKEKINNPQFESKDAKNWRKQWEYADYTSGSITTKNLAEWTYGRIEIKAKLPKGVGLWPAFWMLGENYSEVGWPECGEIDIMEHVGFDPDSIFGTIHTKSYNHMRGTEKGKSTFVEDPYDSYHIYSLLWTPEKMDFLLDGKVYNQIKNENKTTAEWPFDQNFHLKLNIAVGGMLGGREGIDDSSLPSAMIVDYVRVFQKQSDR